MLPDTTHLSTVTLLVKNLELVHSFYKDVIGLEGISKKKGSATLGHNGTPLLVLTEQSSLPYPERGSAGLYHTAFLFERPADLARSLLRIFHMAPTLFQGAGDHLVSQAFYLTDPENNGIELYVDRPRETWPVVNGQLQMDSLPIDIDAFISEHAKAQTGGGVSVGHIHLKVGNIGLAREFYSDTLGFDVIIEHPTALFVSAGSYHHHIGLNTWESENAGQRDKTLGLDEFTVLLPDSASLATVKGRLIEKSVEYAESEKSLQVKDPWGNRLVITASK